MKDEAGGSRNRMSRLLRDSCSDRRYRTYLHFQVYLTLWREEQRKKEEEVWKLKRSRWRWKLMLKTEGVRLQMRRILEMKDEQ